MEKINKYYLGIWTQPEKDTPHTYIYELDNDGFTNRIITIYKDGVIKCATKEGGYLGEVLESVKFFKDKIDQYHQLNDKEFLLFAISSEDFNRQWGKIQTRPDFFLQS